MRTRENSVVISLRVERELQEEFIALTNEVGTLPARKLRESFIQMLEEMRVRANEKRGINGRTDWETEWASRHVEN